MKQKKKLNHNYLLCDICNQKKRIYVFLLAKKKHTAQIFILKKFAPL